MCSWPLWRLYKKGSADVCTVASPPERRRGWPTSIRPGPHTALSRSAISHPKCCPHMEWKLEVWFTAHALRQAQVPKQTDRVITGLADFLEKQLSTQCF